MNEALTGILDYGFVNLGLKRIEAFTHVDNQPSARLLERNRFRLEAGRKDENNPHHIIYSLERP
jgi:ribosomal-protein-alanine N-acetyltransferase